MRVCFCVDHWPPFFPMHGPVRYVQTLARGLVARGIEVHVVTAHPTLKRDFIEHGTHVHLRRAPPARVISRLQPGIGQSYHLRRAIRMLHQKHPFDVVEFTNVEGVGFWSTLFPSCPIVLRIHTTAFDAVRLGIGRVELERGFARLERWTARRASALVTHTETHRAQVSDDYGIPADRIFVVPHGIALPAQQPLVARNTHQVLSVGGVSARKGVGTFLEAASVISSYVPDATFVWAGTDTASAPGGTLWSAYAAERYPGLSGRLEFRSGLSDMDLAALYAGSGVYLCTSLYESFGLTLIEAMLASLPVVAPRTAAMAELVRHRENGWLFEPGSVDDLVAQVRHVFESTDERDDVVLRARQLADREYTADRMTDRMCELYALTIHGRAH